MKKIIALVLALVMMASMSVVVFADPVTVNGDVESETIGAGTKITYGTQQTYTVTIPPQTELVAGRDTEAKAVTISNYKLGVGKSVAITINSANVALYDDAEGDDWYLIEDLAYDGETVTKNSKTATDVPYTVKCNGTAVGRGARIVYANAVATLEIPEVSCQLVFYTDGTSQATNFTDTVTFLATVGSTISE